MVISGGMSPLAIPQVDWTKVSSLADDVSNASKAKCLRAMCPLDFPTSSCRVALDQKDVIIEIRNSKQ